MMKPPPQFVTLALIIREIIREKVAEAHIKKPLKKIEHLGDDQGLNHLKLA